MEDPAAMSGPSAARAASHGCWYCLSGPGGGGGRGANDEERQRETGPQQPPPGRIASTAISVLDDARIFTELSCHIALFEPSDPRL